MDKKIYEFTVDGARERLVEFMMQNFSDKTFHRYIRGKLAGDFAWQIATSIERLTDELALTRAEVDTLRDDAEKLAALDEEMSEKAGAGDTHSMTQAKYSAMTRMFAAACSDLGLINEALGLDANDGGAEPILEAIEELKARPVAKHMSDIFEVLCGQIKGMQEAAYTFGEYSQEAVRAALDGVLDAIGDLTANTSQSPAPRDTCAEMRALCSNCGGTGDIYSIDGEWRGRCDCAASAWSREIGSRNIFDIGTIKRWRIRPTAEATMDEYAAGEYVKFSDVKALVRFAGRYIHLRNKQHDTLGNGGLFAGLTPDNVVINGADLDRMIDDEYRGAAPYLNLTCPDTGESCLNAVERAQPSHEQPVKQYKEDLLEIVRTLVCIADRIASLPDDKREFYPAPTAEGSPLMAAARRACVERGFTDGGLSVDGGPEQSDQAQAHDEIASQAPTISHAPADDTEGGSV